jgi:hypothetical protein
MATIIGAVIGVIAAITVAGAVVELGWAAAGGLAQAMAAGFVGGFVGGLVATGSLSAALTAGLIGAGTAGLFNMVGAYGTVNNWSPAKFVLAHAAVGCASGVASGSNCGRGAAAAALAEVAGESGLIKQEAIGTWGSVKGAAEAGLVGGAAAEITGGNFSEGFSVAAAGYLFNLAAHPKATKLFTSTGGYQSADDAFKAAVAMAETDKDFAKVEFGGSIFRDDAGYEFTLFKGSPTGVPLGVRPDAVAWWHTHPPDPFNKSLDAANEFLSSRADLFGKMGDIDWLRFLDAKYGRVFGAYLYTPSGQYKYFPDAVTRPTYSVIVH